MFYYVKFEFGSFRILSDPDPNPKGLFGFGSFKTFGSFRIRIWIRIPNAGLWSGSAPISPIKYIYLAQRCEDWAEPGPCKLALFSIQSLLTMIRIPRSKRQLQIQNRLYIRVHSESSSLPFSWKGKKFVKNGFKVIRRKNRCCRSGTILVWSENFWITVSDSGRGKKNTVRAEPATG